MAISSEQAEALAARCADFAVFFRLDTDPVQRLWSGAGDFPVPSDAVEPGGTTYKGVGTLQNMPQLGALVNGIAERVSFGLSGVSAEVMEMADSEAALVRNKTVRVGLLPLDANLQPIGTVLWFRSYQADVLGVDRSADNSGNATRNVTLSVGSAFTGRRRPLLSNFTDVDQRRRSADDRFCERTPLYSQGVFKVWPKFSQTT